MVTASPNKTCWLAAVQEEIQGTTGPPKLQSLRFQGGGGSTQSTSDSKSSQFLYLPALVSAVQRLTYDLTDIKHAAGSSNSTGFIWFVRIKKKKEFDDRITKPQNQRAASEHTHISAWSEMSCETKQAQQLQHTFENEVFSVQINMQMSEMTQKMTDTLVRS